MQRKRKLEKLRESRTGRENRCCRNNSSQTHPATVGKKSHKLASSIQKWLLKAALENMAKVSYKQNTQRVSYVQGQRYRSRGLSNRKKLNRG